MIDQCKVVFFYSNTDITIDNKDDASFSNTNDNRGWLLLNASTQGAEHQNTIWRRRDDIKHGDNLHNVCADERMDAEQELQGVEVFHLSSVYQKVKVSNGC